jgi:hypothetical protein
MSLTEFVKVTKDFVTDLLATFPELEKSLDPKLKAVKDGCTPDDPQVAELFEFVSTAWSGHFFDILGEKESMFSTECILLPNIDFKILWNENISDKTKMVIWKYLKLIILTVVGNMTDNESAEKLFEGMREEELKSKLDEATKDIHDFFKDMPVPDPEKLQDHIKGLMTGKLGELAKEIADETVGETTAEKVQDMIKNPAKMFGLVQSVGKKIDTKIKNGELKESELMEEASEMLKKIKDMPGLDEIFKKFGGGGKMDMAGMQSKLHQNMKAAKTKERLQQKLKEKVPVAPPQPAATPAQVPAATEATPTKKNKKKKKNAAS